MAPLGYLALPRPSVSHRMDSIDLEQGLDLVSFLGIAEHASDSLERVLALDRVLGLPLYETTACLCEGQRR